MHELNEDILDKEIRLIGAEGQQLGIMSSQEALKIADEQGLDLVKISPQAVPPVCKLMNYGKFRFEQSKKEKEARKNQHVVEIKEIRMSPGIDVGDFNTKLKNAQKFIADGNRVKVSVRFRGREMAHTDRGGQHGQERQAGGPYDVHLPLSQDEQVNFKRFQYTEGATTMPKLKTHSGAKKRFNLTKTGKVKRAKAFKSHILTKKDTKRTRRLRAGGYADVTNMDAVRKMIPYK